MRRRVAACLYLDNQEEAQFPIEHVVKSVDFVDQWVFAASDEENAEFFDPLYRHAWASTIVTGLKIESSSDISRTMNRVRELVFAQTDADIVVLVQADTLSTPEVNSFLREYVKKMDLSSARWLQAADSQLYLDFQPGWGYSIVGREWPGLFHADGLSNTVKFLYEEFEDVPMCLHIGYLSSAMARRHKRLAARLWGVPEQIPLIDSMDDDEFVYWHIEHVFKHSPTFRPIEEIDERYSKVIDDLGLREDQAFVHDVFERWKVDHAALWPTTESE